MPDRGRDFKFSILSDVSQFDLGQPAQDMDKLATKSQEASRGLDRLGTDAHATARDVASAFSSIPRATTTSFGGLSTSAGKAMGGVRRIFKREGKAAAADLVGSFAGASDLSGVASQMAATVPALFGGIGLIIGGLLSTGIAMFTKEWSEAKAKIEADGKAIGEAMIEAGGQIDRAFISTNLRKLATDGTLDHLKEVARDAGISYMDLAQALAGSEDAIRRVSGEIDAQRVTLTNTSGAIVGATAVQNAALDEASGMVDSYAQSIGLGADAWNAFVEANGTPVTPHVDGGPAIDESKLIWTTVKGQMAKNVYIPIKPAGPSTSELSAALARAQAFANVGIKVPVTYTYPGIGVLRNRP